MSEVQIVEVNNKKQLRKFVSLPNKMYKNVPMIRLSQTLIKYNIFFCSCQAAFEVL